MRKDEMTVTQKNDRDNFFNTLKSNNWQSKSHFNEDFDSGWWVPYQAVLEFKDVHINLEVSYIAGENGQVIVNYSTKRDAPTLAFHFSDSSKDIIDYLIEPKAFLSEDNIKDHFIELVSRFPKKIEISISDTFKPLSVDALDRLIKKGLLSSK